MLELDPSRPLRIEITTISGSEGILELDPATNTLSAENYEPVPLHRFEFGLLGLLASSPNHPFKPADIINGVNSLSEKYAPSPFDVFKELHDDVPPLRGHLIGYTNGATQFFSFLDKADDWGLFEENLNRLLDKTEHLAKDPRRKAKILKGIGLALSAAGTASAVLRYRHNQKQS